MATATPQDMLKEYLIGIGFQVDEPGHKKLDEGIKKLDKGILQYRDDIILTGITLAAEVKSIAGDLQKLYFASQLTGASATELTSWGLAAQAAGISADAAAQATKNFGSSMRSLGNRTLVSMILGPGNITGDSVKDLNTFLTKMGKMGAPGSVGFEAAKGMVQRIAGMNPDDFYLWLKNKPARDAQENALAASRKREGLSSTTYDKTNAEANEFLQKLTLIDTEFGDLKMVLESKLLPLAPRILDFMENFVAWVNKADAGSMAWAAGITAIVSSLGLLGASKLALGFVGRNLGLRGGGAAAVGEGEAVAGGGIGLFGVAGAAAVGVAVGMALDWVGQHKDEVRKAVGAQVYTATGGALGREPGLGGGAAVTPKPGEKWYFPVAHNTMQADTRGWWRRHWDATNSKLFGPSYSEAAAWAATNTRGSGASGDPSGLADIVRGVIGAESNGHQTDAHGHTLTSSAGALGLMQLMPDTAKQLGVDPNDPKQNVAGGTAYLKQLYAKYGNWNQALEAYNWGPGKLDDALKHGTLVPSGVVAYANDVQARAGAAQPTAQTANVVINGVPAGDEQKVGDAAKHGTMSAFSELLRNNNDLGAVPG
jgi:hypothetical protein